MPPRGNRGQMAVLLPRVAEKHRGRNSLTKKRGKMTRQREESVPQRLLYDQGLSNPGKKANE